MEPGKRKKRYVRDRTVKIRLQDRDIAICAWVNKYQLLNSDQIAVILGGSRQLVLRRLNLLFHTGHLVRVKVEALNQNAPMVYGLGKKGGEALTKKFGLVFGSSDWARRIRELKERYVKHTLETNEFLISVLVACRNHPSFEFVDSSELVKNRLLASPSEQQPLKWPVIVNPGEFGQEQKLKLGIIPDGAFAIRFTGEGKKKMSFFFLEIDRSTMPLKRNNLYLSSFYKKLIGYITSYRYKIFGKYWGFNSVRILTVAKSNERIQGLIDLNKELHPGEEGYRLFCFTNTKAISVKDPDKVLKKIWVDGQGTALSLVD